jgi:hypothetical protein
MRLEPEASPGATAARDPEAGQKLVDAASAELAKGRIAESHRLARLAVKARGGVPALVILGDTYLKLGDTEKDGVRKRTDYLRAKRQYTEALRREPTDQNAQEGQAIITSRLSKLTSPDADGAPPMARPESPAETERPGAKK